MALVGCGGSGVSGAVQAYLHDNGRTDARVESCEKTGAVSAGAPVYNCGVGHEAGDLQEQVDAFGLEEMCFAVQGGRVEGVDC